MKIHEYINQTVARFDRAELCYGHGTDNSLDEAVYLIYGTLEIGFEVEPDSLQRVLTEAELAVLEDRVRRRVEQREPVAYVLGEAWFCGIPFYADKRALIPRSPIAELIANRFVPLLDSTPGRILDLCTGGGCIGISCALHFPQTQVDLADISPDALALAQRNIDRHGTSERVRVIQSDLFSCLDEPYDLIVANPPYVSTAEVAALPPEFHHEPRLGLESAEEGLSLPVAILQQAADHLNERGVLVMEVGYSAANLEQRLAGVPLLWLEFEQGGEGVMAITAEELKRYAGEIK